MKTEVRVLKITETGEIFINVAVKPKTKFDIFKTEQLPNPNDPNKTTIIEIPVGRIIITQTFENYSIGTIVSKIDGSKPKVSDISVGMLCRKTTKENIKAEKIAYKNQKRTIKRQLKFEKKQRKLIKIKTKNQVRESLDTIVSDTNNITALKVGRIKVEKNVRDVNGVNQK